MVLRLFEPVAQLLVLQQDLRGLLVELLLFLWVHARTAAFLGLDLVLRFLKRLIAHRRLVKPSLLHLSYRNSCFTLGLQDLVDLNFLRLILIFHDLLLDASSILNHTHSSHLVGLIHQIVDKDLIVETDRVPFGTPYLLRNTNLGSELILLALLADDLLLHNL